MAFKARRSRRGGGGVRRHGASVHHASGSLFSAGAAGSSGAAGLASEAELAVPGEPPELILTIAPVIVTPPESSTTEPVPALIVREVSPSMTIPRPLMCTLDAPVSLIV